MLFTGAFALLFGRARLTGIGALDIVLLLFVVVLAILPYRIGLLGALTLSALLLFIWARQRERSSDGPTSSHIKVAPDQV
jgi:membrane protein implicated in regulation of membrane protease activity